MQAAIVSRKQARQREPLPHRVNFSVKEERADGSLLRCFVSGKGISQVVMLLVRLLVSRIFERCQNLIH